MPRQLFFCKSWFAAKRKPTEIWTEQKAREALSAGKPFTVLVDSIERPFCVIDVAPKFVGIDFLDEKLRECVSYQFQEVSPGRLFLSMATHREFEVDSDKVSRGTTYIFRQDGAVKIRREQFSPEHRLETADSKADVAANYSPAPSFGDYDDLIRIERQPA